MKKMAVSPIRVALYGMEPRSCKTMAMYLQGPCQGIATVVDEVDADVDIIDADFATSGEILDNRRQKTPDRPIILLSLQTLRIENTFFVKKPVNAQQLIEVLQQVRPKSAVASRPLAEVVVEAPPSDQPVTMSTETVSEQPEPAQKSKDRDYEAPASMFLGTVAEIDFSDPTQWPAASFDPALFFLRYVQSAYKIARKESRALQLNSIWKPLLIFPDSGQIWLDADDKQLRVFAGLEQNRAFANTINLKPVDDAVKADKAADKFQDMEAFLWKLTIWTSKGRFPQGLDLKTPVALKRWPNFTRLMLTPEALRMAALLVQGPRTPLDMINVLKISPQYVFAFLSACQSANLLEICEHRPEMEVFAEPPKPTQKHSLLNKILTKLRGK